MKREREKSKKKKKKEKKDSSEASCLGNTIKLQKRQVQMHQMNEYR